MSEKSRQRAVRIFVGSMLASELTRNELREVAEDLAYGRLSGEFSDALREAAGAIKDSPRDYYPVSDVSDVYDPQKTALDAVSRRRLPRKAVINAIAVAAPKLGKKISAIDGSTRELINRYFEVASPAERAKLLNLLTGNPPDPYLKGITRRD